MCFKIQLLPKEFLLIIITMFVLTSCTSNIKKEVPVEENKTELREKRQAEIEANFTKRLQQHLDAISARDLETLERTLSPKGNMLLILPQTEMTTTVSEFMDYHVAWFKEPNWTLESKIIATEVELRMGMAIVEATYREPNRNGEPYYNKMIISYDLKKYNGQWYIIKDHMCSIEKSTDN